jgi:cold shock CspA family protein
MAQSEALTPEWEDLIRFALGKNDEAMEATASKVPTQSSLCMLSANAVTEGNLICSEAVKEIRGDSWEDIIKFAAVNTTASHEALSEVDTQFDAQSSSSEEEKEVEQQAEMHEQAICTKYEGNWTQAFIRGNKLTWNQGEHVEIQGTSSTTFSMKYLGTTYSAKLQEDGKLHWDDGDVWVRRVEDKLLPPWLRRKRRTTREQDAAVSTSATKSEAGNLAHAQGQSINGQDHAKSASIHCHTMPNAPQRVVRAKAQEVVRMDVQTQKTYDREFASSLPSSVAEAVLKDCEDFGHCDSSGVPLKQEDSTRINTSKFSSCCETKAINLRPMDKRVYRGIVKYFRGAFGWIVCEELAAVYPCNDVMVHKLDCAFRPKQGDKVSFRVALNDRGNPQAVKVQLSETVEINARDWFAERAKLTARLTDKVKD